MTLQELKIISYLMEVVSNGDRNFESISNHRFNLHNLDDARMLLTFLNSWGCRQFIIEQHTQAANRLRTWFSEYESSLPTHKIDLMSLSDNKIRGFSVMFDDLMNLRASTDSRGVNKRFGPVGAAKALFALRKNIFPPWDNPIGNNQGYEMTGTGYTRYMLNVKEQIIRFQSECEKHHLELKDIPEILNRPNVTMAKLVDEYHWLTITRRFNPTRLIELANE